MRISLLRFRSVIVSLVLLLGLAARAGAAQITLAWDANPEPDVTGYIVEYGSTTAPFSQSVDVGNVTTWVFSNATAGVGYSFRVIAYNSRGERSDPSTPVSTEGASLTPERTSLAFGMIAGSTQQTASQTLRLTQSGAGAVSWTASSSASWLQVSPASGNGSSLLTVTLAAGAPAAGGTASITITATGAANAISPIPVSLKVVAATASQAPFGAVDTPADNVTGVTGSLAMTGWALDDVDVTRVRIYRNALPGEGAGMVYIGDATSVEDARPDVAATYSAFPRSYRAGWGYLLLTNMLPSRGNGTFRFSAYAEDGGGRSTLLGTRTVTCSNDTATLPFGAIDTPAPGGNVSGNAYVSFGWVLARGARRADVPGGGTTRVFIDGVDVGAPSGWSARGDLAAIFPASQYSGINNAAAAFAFDTTAMSNGVHTMSWVVRDDQGNAAGIGSRYFRVFNGNSALLAEPMQADAEASVDLDIAGATIDVSGVEARRGYSEDVPFRRHGADDGRVTLQSEELDRIELKVNASAGYLVVPGGLRPLPIGSTFDAASGTFTWQPGVGFVGAYDFVFFRREAGTTVRQDVRIVLNPKGSNRVGPQVVVDLAGEIVAGWAADLDSPSGTGIDAIHVWAYPTSPSTGSGQAAVPVFLGQAAYGGERPDVAGVYGDRFQRSGFGLRVNDLPPGTYDLAVFAWSDARRAWLPATVVRISR